jgi:hypothetical protein
MCYSFYNNFVLNIYMKITINMDLLNFKILLSVAVTK